MIARIPLYLLHLLLFFLIGCGDTSIKDKNTLEILSKTKQSTLVNNAPLAFSASMKVTKNRNCFSTLNAIDSDGDEIIFSLVSQPTKGRVLLQPNGMFM